MAMIVAAPLAANAALKDVGNGTDFASAIVYLEGRGVVSGYPDGTYKPLNKINRAEFLKIMIEANNFGVDYEDYADESCFSDVPANQWFTKYVCFAEDNGIVSGYPDGTFKPSDYINLAEASKIVVNSFDIETFENSDPWFKDYIQALEARKAIPNGLEDFGKEINRGEMAEITYRLITENTTLSSTEVYCTGEGESLGSFHPSSNAYCCSGLEIMHEDNELLGNAGYCGVPTDSTDDEDNVLIDAEKELPAFDTLEEYVAYIHGSEGENALSEAPGLGFEKIGINVAPDGGSSTDYIIAEANYAFQGVVEFYIWSESMTADCDVMGINCDEGYAPYAWYGPFEGHVVELLGSRLAEADANDMVRIADTNTIASAVILWLADNDNEWGENGGIVACAEEWDMLEDYLPNGEFPSDPVTGKAFVTDAYCESGYLIQNLDETTFAVWTDVELAENGNADTFIIDLAPAIEETGDYYANLVEL